MDINKPEVDFSHQKPRLCMFCPEERIPREIFWAGFGFQVWCQMLTHLVQSNEKSLFLIDEPDIYLHSDLQRQLLSLLRNLGPDILVATHSTEIITEAEPDDIVLVNKKRNHARRINNPSQLAEVFLSLGSNLNPILTQLAKTRKVLFVEGKDFQIFGKFAHRLAIQSAGTRSNFAVVAIDGFNPERVRNLRLGMETTIGGNIQSFLILDRDYRSDRERKAIVEQCETFCDQVVIHERKEIENYLLVPSALDRAIARRVEDHAKRTGNTKEITVYAEASLREYSSNVNSYVMAQHLARRRAFEAKNSIGTDEGTFNEETLNSFHQRWETERQFLGMIPGKEALSYLNKKLQEEMGISITPTSIIDAMQLIDIPEDIRDLISKIAVFAES